MSEQPVTIPKQPKLKPAADFYGLRREGIGFIEQMGSQLWTDYNTHDPGITILEALCYALTDLAYRIGWDIQDLLAPATPLADPDQPYPDQPFFTAREILTVNPWTPNDFRRLLIDFAMVRNAWVFCREQACDAPYYAWCEDDELTLAYQSPANPRLTPKKVEPRGLYNVLLELESDPAFGDLNDRKIEHTFQVVDPADTSHTITMELRFPEWKLEKQADWGRFLHNNDAFTEQNGPSFSVNISHLGATKTYNVLTDPNLTPDERNAYLRDHWRTIFYISFELTFQPSGEPITIDYAALRLLGSSAIRNEVTVPNLVNLLTDSTSAGFIQRYRHKLLKVEEAVSKAKTLLHTHRNLGEDYCRITGVNIEDVSVCADVEVAPDADIERVQAQIWFEIEQYFNPPVSFYTLQELQDDGVAVENIFNGPALHYGFIKTNELEAAQLKVSLRTSDIINLLMDIEGVVAVNNLLLAKYDAEGNVIPGAADPSWVNGAPVFEPNRTSALWLLFMSDLHQPRLYHNQSRFLFYKNGLTFLPRGDEASDTLTQLRGEAERPKILNAAKDLAIPVGTVRNLNDHAPVQYSFPFTYGIGPDGLPSNATDLRQAQAKQLKAYLMVYEQLLGNAFMQVAKVGNLFSLDPTIDRTYFVRELSESLIRGYDEIASNLGEAELNAMTETEPEFLERRNRFLNHIMARFGEQFSEYALLLTNQQGQQVAQDRLIADKISFLKAYPRVSRNRGQAFNYRVAPCAPNNISGLKKRISLLLGYPDLTFSWQVTDLVADQYDVAFRLLDQHTAVWLAGQLTIESDRPGNVTTLAFRAIISQMIQSDAYVITPETSQFRLQLQDQAGDPLAQSPKTFPSEADATKERDELLSWSSNERAIIVEHLLLRPKFPGDALYPACTDGPCETCGEEDPYSFRLTFVMPGWAAPFNENLEMRSFANRTIQQEAPAHLLSKICWVGNDGFIEDPCDPIIDELTQEGWQFERFEDAWCKWLEANAEFDWTEERLPERVEAILAQNVETGPAVPANYEDALSDCASEILAAYGTAFYTWMETNIKAGNTLDNLTDFTPDPINLCSDFTFNPGTAAMLDTLLQDRYNRYTTVSYRLWVVLHHLSQLRSIFPPATLHDCDDGSDQNPVRLGQTALGN